MRPFVATLAGADRRRSAAIAFAAVFAACVSRPLPPVDASLRATASALRADLALVERGRELLVGECATCHEPVHPFDCSLAVWHEVMPRMLRKSELPPGEGRCVLAYVQLVMAAAPR